MRHVIRNSFARHTITAERVRVNPLIAGTGCTACGQSRQRHGRKTGELTGAWLYRFHVDDDQGPRHSGPIAGGKLFCSRGCCETYTGRNFDETRGDA